MVMNRPLHLLICITLAALMGLQGFAVNDIHQWTDAQGRIIRASFVKADDKAVTVRLQGAQSMIRSTDLSPQSQAKLRTILFIGTPDEVLLSLRAGQGAKKEERNDFLDWTDKKGRTIRARIVKFVGDNLTVELEGAIHELPLAQLNAESQKLAQSLAEESSRPGPQAVVGKDEQQEWKDANGRTIRARFINLVTETLTIEMNGHPFDLPLASLSPDSQVLARQLASDVKQPPDKTPQEKPVGEQIAKAMGNGPPDQAEITLALNQAVEYFRTLAAKDEEGLFYPPIRRRKAIGYSDKKVMYRKIVAQIPVHEWTTITKEVVRNVKVGDSGAVTVKKKVKVPVRVRGKQTGTRPQNRLVRDKNGTIERIHKVAKYGPGGTVEWKSGQLGQNALVIYALIKSGVDPFDELISRPLETFSYLYNTFGLPDSTWDLAWSICAFANSGLEEHRELASQMAAKLAGAQMKSGQAAGLWGPVGLDTELLGAILSANADTSAEYLRFKEKFDKKKKEYDENKMKEALELIRRTNNLKGRYTMMAKESSVYFRVILKDKGFSETAGQVFNLIAFPLYLYNQTTVDLETTALVLHALSVASTKDVLPKETTTLRPKGSRQTLGKSRTLPQVLASAANAIAKGQFKDGSFHQLNFHQPVNDFDKSLLIRGVPADPATFPKLESPTTIASAAQGFATLNAFAAIAGEQAASRYARNFQAATARVVADLPSALFVDLKQTVSSSTFGPYDLAFSIFANKSSDSLATLAAPVTRFLIDGQSPNGSWQTTNRFKSLISSSLRARSKLLPQYTGKGFNWAQAWVLPDKWNNSYYPTPAGIVPTSYAMLALANAIEYAPQPEEVTSIEESASPNEIPPNPQPK